MQVPGEGLGSMVHTHEERNLEQVKSTLLSKMWEESAGVEGCGEAQKKGFLHGE